MSESTGNGPCGGARPCPPRFPVFPIVFPLIFPIGFTLLMGRLRKRRRQSLKARLTKIEERLDDLSEKLPLASD